MRTGRVVMNCSGIKVEGVGASVNPFCIRVRACMLSTLILPTVYPDRILNQLVDWANQQQLIRAVILTSSRAIPNAALDLFSDYDVILVLRSIQPLYIDRTWLEVFGPVLTVYRDPLIEDDGLKRSAYVVQYENGLKIDFSLWPVELLQRVTRNE